MGERAPTRSSRRSVSDRAEYVPSQHRVVRYLRDTTVLAPDRPQIRSDKDIVQYEPTAASNTPSR